MPVFLFLVFVLLALFADIIAVVAMALATTIARWEASSWCAREGRLPISCEPATELAAPKRLNGVLQQQLAGMKEGARAEADAKAALEWSSALELSEWIAANGGLNRSSLASDYWHTMSTQHKDAHCQQRLGSVYFLREVPYLKDGVSEVPSEGGAWADLGGRSAVRQPMRAGAGAPWGEAGQDFRIPDLTGGHLDVEMPDCFREKRMDTVEALVDGRNFATETTRTPRFSWRARPKAD